MRIFLVLKPSGNQSVSNSLTWLHNLYEPLLDLGHDVYLVRVDTVAKEYSLRIRKGLFKQIFSQILLEKFKKEYLKKPFDFFLSYLTDLDVETSVIDEIKRCGVPTANFSCNNTHQFYLTKIIAPHFEYNLHSEKDASEKFRMIGANPVWFPMAANPKYYHTINVEKDIDVSFIGANYARRPYYIWHLLENDINVHCYGPKWLVNKPYPFARNIAKEFIRNWYAFNAFFSLSAENRSHYSSNVAHYDFQKRLRIKYKKNMHYPISDDEMIKIYNRSKIVLGFLEVFDNHDASMITKQHLHLREFEVPMCGALHFTNYSEELSEFYESDKEIVIYRNEHELLDKVRYYLSHPNEALRIREAGYKRAFNCHTYQKRYQELFNCIGLK